MENIGFLKRLFASCSDETGSCYADGLNLSELYESAEEATTGMKHFNKAIDAAALPVDMTDEISAAAYEMARDYELQGFVNGFRMCARLGKELGGREAAQ